MIDFSPNILMNHQYSHISLVWNQKCETQMLKLKTPIVFGAATQTLNGDTGVLGLGLPNSAADESLTDVFDQMIKDGLLDSPIFTTMYKPCADSDGCKKAGMLTLGGLDETSCEAVAKWFPVPESAKQWSVSVEKWIVNKYKYMKPSTAILDPTSPNIQVVSYILMKKYYYMGLACRIVDIDN